MRQHQRRQNGPEQKLDAIGKEEAAFIGAPRPPVTPTRRTMEAARAEEGEPPAGSLTLAIRTLTGGTTTLRDVVSLQTVHAVTLRLCAETGGEPTLTRLLHEQRPLADRKRSLEEYGIVGDAELHVSPLLPEKTRRRHGRFRHSAGFSRRRRRRSWRGMLPPKPSPKSAPPPKALAISPAQVQPPSAIIYPPTP